MAIVTYQEVQPEEALERIGDDGVVVLDVRTWREWLCGHIPGAMHIPLDELPTRSRELDPEARLLVVCQHGIRSANAAAWLTEMGFEHVTNVRHGMSRWPGPVEFGRGSF